MLSIHVGYPSAEEESRIVKSTTSSSEPELQRVLGAEDILRYQQLVRRVPVSDRLADFAVKLARATRPADPSAGEFVKEWVEWGAGPRASQYLVLGAKARALLSGRFAVSEDDVRALAPAVLRHRIVVNFRAEAEGLRSDDVVQRVLRETRA